MTRILHIITQPDPLAEGWMALERGRDDLEVHTADLRCKDPDYDDLVRQVFEADSVRVW